MKNPDDYTVLNAGFVRGVTELMVNGVNLGTKWYGEHAYSIDGKLQKGRNMIVIKVTTPLGNYANSLVNNRTAKRYAHTMKSLGLENPVCIY